MAYTECLNSLQKAKGHSGDLTSMIYAIAHRQAWDNHVGIADGFHLKMGIETILFSTENEKLLLPLKDNIIHPDTDTRRINCVKRLCLPSPVSSILYVFYRQKAQWGMLTFTKQKYKFNQKDIIFLREPHCAAGPLVGSS